MSIRKRTSKKSKNGYVYEVYFPYKVNGITERYSRSGFKTKKEAQEHETMMLAELHETGKLLSTTNKTLNDVYNEFLETSSQDYQENTITNIKRQYKKYVMSTIGNIPIKGVDYALLQGFFNKRSNLGYETNKMVKRAINLALNHAIKVGYINQNPLRLVKISGKEKKKDCDPISLDSELNTILTELKKTNDFGYKAYSIAIQIGKFTGLRISEVFALDKNDIDFENNKISVNKKMVYLGLKTSEVFVSPKLKSKKSKASLPLTSLLKNILIDWFKVNPYDHIICNIEGKHIHPNTFYADIENILTKHNINFHFHMLRHTFATTLVNNEVDIKTTQELMRHASFNTTMNLYTHISDTHKENVVNGVFGIKSVEKVSKIKDKVKTLN